MGAALCDAGGTHCLPIWLQGCVMAMYLSSDWDHLGVKGKKFQIKGLKALFFKLIFL